MADILLTHSNHLFSDRKQVKKMQPYPPLQTLWAAALLREQGFDAVLFDPTLEDPDSGFARALEMHRPRLVAVVEDNFNFLTKMCLTRNRELAFRMSATAARAGVPICINGSDANDHTAEYLGAGFQLVMLGEVEATMVEVAGHIVNGSGELKQIAGIAYSGGRTVPRERIRDLDRLPSPAWDLVDIPAYRAAWNNAHGSFSLNLVSSRGCPYRCNWCAKPIYGSNYQSHSPERVAAEVLRLKREFAPDQIWFGDDIFALSPTWARKYADEIERIGALVPFKMQSRCDLMTRDTVSALARAGCREVWMGAESGSQRVLDAMEKGIRVEQIHEARANLARHDIRACFFLQFGYPGENWEDIQRTLDMVRRTRPDDIGVSVAYPLPGTKFHERVLTQLGSQQNWCDSADLAMMFRGAYSSDFYRALAGALHREAMLGWRQSGDPELARAWRMVRELEQISANPEPTAIWTCS
jgi:radical SAM superfamily enzyme YgiQ (UPF0313 family)